MQASPLSLLTSRIRAYCRGKVRLIPLQGHSFNCLPGPAKTLERQTISGSQKDAGAAGSRDFLQQAAAGTAVRTGIFPESAASPVVPSCGVLLRKSFGAVRSAVLSSQAAPSAPSQCGRAELAGVAD